MDMPVKVEGDAVVTFGTWPLRRSFEDRKNSRAIDGQPALVLEVTKRVGANIIETVDARGGAEKSRGRVAGDGVASPILSGPEHRGQGHAERAGIQRHRGDPPGDDRHRLRRSGCGPRCWSGWRYPARSCRGRRDLGHGIHDEHHRAVLADPRRGHAGRRRDRHRRIRRPQAAGRRHPAPGLCAAAKRMAWPIIASVCDDARSSCRSCSGAAWSASS